MAHLQIPMIRYPRTPHLHGSGIQTGDSKETVWIDALPDDLVVVEEKIDGANSGLSFHEDEETQGWTMLGQSRGHYLDMATRGGRERQWNAYKDWAASVEDVLLDRIETRYRLFAEWTSVAHTVFYDALPHHWHEFDVLDQAETERLGEPIFLATDERHDLLAGLPFVHVPVLWKGRLADMPDLRSLIVPTPYKTAGWRTSFAAAVERSGLRMEDTVGHIEDSDLMEGLYVKVERNGRVVSRYKYVRGEFVQTIVEDNSHWLSRPFVLNGLKEGRDILAWNVAA